MCKVRLKILKYRDYVIHGSFDVLWKLELSIVITVYQEKKKNPEKILYDHILPREKKKKKTKLWASSDWNNRAQLEIEYILTHLQKYVTHIGITASLGSG